MGPSGAGRSTLLSILGMLDGAWTGEFEFVNHMVHRMKPKDRVELNKKYIGFVFQSYHLIDNLTVYENLDIPLSYRNVKARSAPPRLPPSARVTQYRKGRRRSSHGFELTYFFP